MARRFPAPALLETLESNVANLGTLGHSAAFDRLVTDNALESRSYWRGGDVQLGARALPVGFLDRHGLAPRLHIEHMVAELVQAGQTWMFNALYKANDNDFSLTALSGGDTSLRTTNYSGDALAYTLEAGTATRLLAAIGLRALRDAGVETPDLPLTIDDSGAQLNAIMRHLGELQGEYLSQTTASFATPQADRELLVTLSHMESPHDNGTSVSHRLAWRVAGGLVVEAAVHQRDTLSAIGGETGPAHYLQYAQHLQPPTPPGDLAFTLPSARRVMDFVPTVELGPYDYLSTSIMAVLGPQLAPYQHLDSGPELPGVTYIDS